MARPIAPDLRDALAALVAKRYARGETLREIAGDIGRSYGTTHALALEGGVGFRSRGWPKGRSQRRTTEGAEDHYGQPDPNHDVAAELARYDFTKRT